MFECVYVCVCVGMHIGMNTCLCVHDDVCACMKVCESFSVKKAKIDNL